MPSMAWHGNRPHDCSDPEPAKLRLGLGLGLGLSIGGAAAKGGVIACIGIGSVRGAAQGWRSEGEGGQQPGVWVRPPAVLLVVACMELLLNSLAYCGCMNLA
ncbi:hypothetical protein V8C86DRAFT_2887461 [Haematococcus lacustris]